MYGVNRINDLLFDFAVHGVACDMDAECVFVVFVICGDLACRSGVVGYDGASRSLELW